jgi:hypothetical protein
MNSPCLDHDNCPLDLEALRRRSFSVFQRRMVLRRGVHEVRLQLAQASGETWAGVLTVLNNLRGELSALDHEQRLLYMTRAHHRGRVAELNAERYQKHALVPTLQGCESYRAFVKRMLPLQAVEVASTWARFVRKPRAVAE